MHRISLLVVFVVSAANADTPKVKLTLNMDLVKNPTLDAANPQVVKVSHNTSPYTVEYVIEPIAKITTKKFTLSGMDLDDPASPIGKLTEDQCQHYLVNLAMTKTTPQGPTDVFKQSIHGVWEDLNQPGKVPHCLLKDGFGVPPKVVTNPLPVPASGSDTYFVKVDAGFTKSAFPNNAAESIITHRKTKATISMSN